ncbi:hypothetical protein [Mycobacterium sp. SMC-4]|uniref:hypothetical protein n=1 Tax=Mycobacterium sp. SMC-4 TaxID=2857059 RepID=UPI003D005845
MARRPRDRQPDTVRVAALDVQHSYRRSAVVLGPFELPSADLLTQRLLAMAHAGPEARVGLIPSTTSTRWRFAPESVAGAVHTISRAPQSEPTELVAHLRRLPPTSLRVLAADDYLALDFSHGLGEIPLLDLLIAVLLGVVDPADDTLWKPYRHTTPPLVSAAARAIGLSPHRLLPLWRQHRRHAGTVSTSDPPSSTTVASSTSTRVLRIPEHDVNDIRVQRDSHLPGVSLFAAYTCALHAAFADEGFDIEPEVTVPVDVRRYLPQGRGTLGSFSAGLSFPVEHADPRHLHDAMTDATRIARPVANLVAGTVKAHVALRSGAQPVRTAPARPRMRLLHSSVGEVPRSAWSFSDPAHARVLVASDPAGPCGVTVTTSSVLGTAWLTAEFHDAVFDPERIGAALATVPARARALLTPRGR